MKVAAFIGRSGSGKTTAIVSLIRYFVAEGNRVGAIKHTHHTLNEEDRGNTAEFRRAGAEPVILAGDREAVIFSGSSTRRIKFAGPDDLLDQLGTEIVFVEGFKSIAAWPQIELSQSRHFSTAELLTILDRIWRS
ncbi:MAG TPA: molybdopterin-guanine dinucleotide biosynthesis protein MobB [Thermoanaerobaculia bacterium]|nr:molybdopterin-guanine dinucleotide biosynthesis protein MobB [Thermoanaerobaculia bacterium]